MGHHRLVVCALLSAAALSACHTRGLGGDGGLDATSSDAPGSDVAGPLALDFSVTGCASFDLTALRCTGTPPLTVTFAPVSSPSLTRFVWTFGDGGPTSSERAPTHTYLLPGSYDVGVVAEGALGSVSRTHAQLVVVSPIAAGAPCDVDAQCAAGLACLCGGGACAPAFPRGLCVAACPAAGCAAGTACAILEVPTQVAPASDGGSDGPSTESGATDGGATADGATADGATDGGASDGGVADGGATDAAGRDADARDAPAAEDGSASEAASSDAASADAPTADGSAASADAAPPAAATAAPTATPLCLATCATDTDCAAGLVCRALPGAGGPEPHWARTCVPPAFRDVGDSCRDATGALADGLCATNACADLGALGVCSATCGVGAACPSGSSCATFADGRSLCLVSCSPAFSCARDPLLDCEGAGGVGALSFQVSPPAPAATFCAPRACTTQADCGAAGTCAPPGVGAHCTRD